MIKQSLALRVLVLTFIVLALPLLVDSFLFFQNTYNDAIQDAKRELKEIADFRSYSLAEIQPIKEVFLTSLIYLLNLHEQIDHPDKESLSRQLKEVSDLVGGNLGLYLIANSPGPVYSILASNREQDFQEKFISYLSFKKVIQAQEDIFIRYMYSQKKRRYVPSLFVAHVITSAKNGEPMAIFMVVADIEKELDLVLSEVERYQSVQFAILNGDGIVFRATDSSLLGHHFDPISKVRRNQILETGQLGPFTVEERSLPIIQGNDPPFFEFIFDDQVQIAYRAYLSQLGLSVVAYSPKEVFFGQAIKHFLFLYTVYGLILVIGGGVAYWLSQWIARPLRQLSHLMGEVSEGKFEERFQKEPLGFEINHLGLIFNSTLDTLLMNIQKAEDERLKKEIYQRELAIARQVQQNLLPHGMPKMEGIELVGAYLPAIEVGGDFYGWLTKKNHLGEDVLTIGVGDAPGRGISACLYALNARSLARSYAMIYDDMGEMLRQTNNKFLEDAGDSGMFVTLFWCYYSPHSKILSYYSFGHVPGIIRQADGHLRKLSHAGMALGLVEAKEPYKPAEVQLNPGDLVVLYTDGLLEVTNDKHQRFSERHLTSFLQKKKWDTAQEVVDGLTKEVLSFTNSLPQEEEVVIVALKVLE